MSDVYIPATEYAERLGITEVPDWLPELSREFLALADEFDATRDESGYGPASVAFAMELEPWRRRPHVIIWALIRALLGQPGSAAVFRGEVVDRARWTSSDALWVASVTPARPQTARLMAAALQSVSHPDLPLAAGDVARLRSVATAPDLLKGLDLLEASLASTPKAEEVLDPRFTSRIAHTLKRPILELLHSCATKRPEPPPRWRLEQARWLAKGRHDDIRAILDAIPGHLEEHGSFTRGEDTLRGLIFVAESFGKGWIIPACRDIILAAGGTVPPRSQKLANAAVEALYHRRKAKSTLEDLRERVPGKALRKRIAMNLEYM